MSLVNNFTFQNVSESLNECIPLVDDGDMCRASEYDWTRPSFASQDTSRYSSPYSPASETQSSGRRSHARRRAPGYVARPRNAFIIYRSHFIATTRAQATNKQTQFSKMAGSAWNMMSEEQKAPFNEMAATEKARHARMHPDYIYFPNRARSRERPRKSDEMSRRLTTSSFSITPAASPTTECYIQRDELGVTLLFI